jgi:hypothetical protein
MLIFTGQIASMKIMDFKCYTCEEIFQAEGVKKEYIDPMYGPCAKMVADCPICHAEATEYRAPKPQKAGVGSSADIAPCGMTPGQAGCGCCSG